jgi:hypothetical protein
MLSHAKTFQIPIDAALLAMTGAASSREHGTCLRECVRAQLESTNETFVPDGTTLQ